MNAKTTSAYQPWNKGQLVGQKSPLRLRDIWDIRIRLDPVPYGTHTMRRTKASLIDLSENKKHQSSTDTSRSHQAGKHCQMPWHRSGRRA